MSKIEVSHGFAGRLALFDQTVRSELEKEIEAQVLAMQQEAAHLAPSNTGKLRETLASPEAVKKSKGRDGGEVWTFGFITPAMRKAAFYGFWVEFGTKGYQKGDRRDAGTTKDGRKRKTKIKRHIPARPAQPFFRPAFAHLVLRMRQQRNWARIVGAAKRAAGFSDAA